MRTRDALLIFRFLTWPPALLAILGLAAVGFFMNATGLTKPRDPDDLVCIGSKRYDLSDTDDRNELLTDLSSMKSAPSSILQRPPCNMFGSPISSRSMKKILGQ